MTCIFHCLHLPLPASSMTCIFHCLHLPLPASSMTCIFHDLHLSLPASSITCIFDLHLCLHLPLTCIFHCLHLPLPASSMTCIFHDLHLPWPAFSIACIFHCLHLPWPASSMTCIFHGLHLPWSASSMTCIFHCLHLPLPASSIACIFHYLHLSLSVNKQYRLSVSVKSALCQSRGCQHHTIKACFNLRPQCCAIQACFNLRPHMSSVGSASHYSMSSGSPITVRKRFCKVPVIIGYCHSRSACSLPVWCVSVTLHLVGYNITETTEASCNKVLSPICTISIACLHCLGVSHGVSVVICC